MSNTEALAEEIQNLVFSLWSEEWVYSKHKPELYSRIRSHEHKLKAIFRDWFHYPIYMGDGYVRLIKRPERRVLDPNPTHSLKYQIDFVLYACVLAFMEEKGEDQQFVLRELLESIKAYYPGGPDAISWSDHGVRTSLIRVIKTLEQERLLLMFDRTIDQFRDSEDYDLLIQVSNGLRHAIRQTRVPLSEFSNMTLLREALHQEEIEEGILCEQRIWRRLFAQGCLFLSELSQDEEIYAERHGLRMQQKLEEVFQGVFLERYASTWLLVHDKPREGKCVYPTYNTHSHIVTAIGTHLRDRLDQGENWLNHRGYILLHAKDAFDLFVSVRRANQDQLAKSSLSDRALWEEVADYMKQLGLLKIVNDEWIFSDALGRVAGEIVEEEVPPKEDVKHALETDQNWLF
ncbi:DUF2398 family protein [Paenibacillus bouchesdurhonensis]|uniref:DUF2398 family protein n=1 Tax=Paenibacillus bouchesdurhonensis TaxID=1870990 RepID=UPI001901FE70|nr:DUF2398 family protein [Paenibacillus bouchesdurhonensis]